MQVVQLVLNLKNIDYFTWLNKSATAQTPSAKALWFKEAPVQRPAKSLPHQHQTDPSSALADELLTLEQSEALSRCFSALGLSSCLAQLCHREGC